MDKYNSSEKEKITGRLTEQMRHHRKALGLTQGKAAELLGRPEKTYQRWESTGEGLSDFFVILDIFRVLRFPTTEIIGMLGLPPLTESEVKEYYRDEKTLKSIQDNGIYSAVCQNCGGLGSITIEKLLCVLLKEYLKRKGHKF